MTDLLKRQRVEVRTEGELVLLKIGNATLTMGYEDALKISTWMRVRAKEAKTNAGDVSRHWTVIGQLSAVEHGERPW